jgi:hypothetical protein
MRRRLSLAAALLAGVVALATADTSDPQLVTHALTTIDTVPTKTQLDSVFPSGEALLGLSAIARDGAADQGMRLRAIHALAKYCTIPCSTSEVAHETLMQLIVDNRQQQSGYGLLLLRASIETIGSLRVASDVSVLVPLLDHPSRDIRAATARALRDLCNLQAITPLRVRYTSESTEQVKLAISEALRILGQCSSN